MTERPPAPHSDVRELDIDGKVTLFHTKTQTALVLNETASDVWRLLDGERTTAEIVALLSEAYHTDQARVREGVEAALRQLLGHQLINHSQP